MRLTAYTDLALRVLIHVALKDGDLARISEVASSFDVSRNHLTKVVHNLATRGYLSTVRGRNGGMRLARPARTINLGQVVRDFEPDFTLVECFDPPSSRCCIQSACILKGVLHEATNAFLACLDDLTLADLLRPHRSLQRSLGLPVLRSLAGG